MGPAESATLYKHLFESTVIFLQKFENFAFDGAFMVVDASEAITKAAEEIRPKGTRDDKNPIICLLDWTHICKTGLLRNRDKLPDPTFFGDAQDDLRIIRQSRNPSHDNPEKAVLTKWEQKGERQLISWFRLTLDTAPHDKFASGDSGVPGVPGVNCCS